MGLANIAVFIVGVFAILGGLWKVANLASEQIFATRENTRAIRAIMPRLDKLEKAVWRRPVQ